MRSESTTRAPEPNHGAGPGEETLILEGREGMLQATRKLVVLVVVVVCLLVVGNLTAFGGYLRDFQSLQDDLVATGVPLWLLVPVATAVFVALGSPRLILSGAGGFLLGFWKGLALSYVGSLVGSIGTFAEIVLLWNENFITTFSGDTPTPLLAVGPVWAELLPRLEARLETESGHVEWVDGIDDAIQWLSLRS